MNRETWLALAVSQLHPWFLDAGYDKTPLGIHVSTGFPSKLALSAKKQRIGECWHPRVSQDGIPHIFISPVLSDVGLVLATLVHEIGHAAVGVEHGHKAPFKSMMGKLGLEGKPTATVAGAQLTERLHTLVSDVLGPYPHPAFNATAFQDELDSKKQTTRMLKVICPNGDETNGKVYTVRLTKLHLESFGPPVCPKCEEMMVTG